MGHARKEGKGIVYQHAVYHMKYAHYLWCYVLLLLYNGDYWIFRMYLSTHVIQDICNYINPGLELYCLFQNLNFSNAFWYKNYWLSEYNFNQYIEPEPNWQHYGMTFLHTFPVFCIFCIWHNEDWAETLALSMKHLEMQFFCNEICVFS